MDMNRLIDDYLGWLRSEISFEQCGEYYEITTPFLDNANDYLQIYVKQADQEIHFTDDCATMRSLDIQGLRMTPKRRKQLGQILKQYGVELSGDELIAKAPMNQFAQKKHMFIQAMLKVNDLMFTANSKNITSFLDDIMNYFLEKEIYYTDGIQIVGKSGFLHSYDFVFQRSKTKNERFCRAINKPDKNSLETTLFAWTDTAPQRKDDSQLVVILNDSYKYSPAIVEGFKSYDVEVFPWSERELPENLALISAS